MQHCTLDRSIKGLEPNAPWISASMKLLQAVLAVYLFAFCCGERQRFDNYRVYTVSPTRQDQLEALRTLESKRDDALVLNHLHLGPTDFLVAPSYNEQFLELLSRLELVPELIDENAQSSLSLDIEPVADSNRRSDDYTWSEYHELNDTQKWMQNLVAKYPDTVSLFVAGRSYEGRELLGMKISHKDGRADRQAIFLEAGMHAREWIGPATATYFANELLTSQKPDIIRLSKSYVWYILPHANPDGYVYTHTTVRMKRFQNEYFSK